MPLCLLVLLSMKRTAVPVSISSRVYKLVSNANKRFLLPVG